VQVKISYLIVIKLLGALVK